MKITTSFLAALLLVGSLIASGTPVGADEFLSKTELDPGSNYCHMKFPAIQETTVRGGHPVLKGSDTGDIIDYYGPCDHDPLGNDEVQSQKSLPPSDLRAHD